MEVHNTRTHKRAALSALSLSATAAILLASAPTAFAQNFCANRITDTQQRQVQRISKPQALESYIDPAFGTRVTRVTDAPDGTAHRTLYNTIQPWNNDESLLVLYHTGDENAGHHLYDGKTYRYLRALEFSASDIEGIHWDKDDSDLMYFVQRRPSNDSLYGKLVRYNVSTRVKNLVADLDPICGAPSQRGGKMVRGGNDIQGIAGHKIGLRCVNNEVSGTSSDITFTVDVRTGKVSPTVTLNPALPQGGNSFGFRPDVAATPMHSSQRVVIQDSVYDADMNYLYRLDSYRGGYRANSGTVYPAPQLEHSTSGRMPNRNDAIFSPRYNPLENGCDGDSDFGRGSLVAHDVQSGTCKVMVGRSTGWGYPLSGVHLSSVSLDNPGWVTMTSIGYRNLDYLYNGRSAPLLFSELSLTYADPDNPQTCRLAHTRTLGKSASRGASYRSAYFGEPHAIMSPSGTRILFNSDWYDSGSVDTYSVQLDTGPTDSNPVATALVPVQDGDIANPAADAIGSEYELSTQVRLTESPPRVYVDFTDPNRNSRDRISIARAGSPDTHLLMRLNTNGTPNAQASGPLAGRISFLQKYIGSGDFEARLTINGDYSRVVKRASFTIPNQ